MSIETHYNKILGKYQTLTLTLTPTLTSRSHRIYQTLTLTLTPALTLTLTPALTLTYKFHRYLSLGAARTQRLFFQRV
jgi:hypothetical protein